MRYQWKHQVKTRYNLNLQYQHRYPKTTWLQHSIFWFQIEARNRLLCKLWKAGQWMNEWMNEWMKKQDERNDVIYLCWVQSVERQKTARHRHETGSRDYSFHVYCRLTEYNHTYGSVLGIIFHFHILGNFIFIITHGGGGVFSCC